MGIYGSSVTFTGHLEMDKNTADDGGEIIAACGILLALNGV